MDLSKSIHTVVLDAGPMLKNNPPISSLIAKAERLATVPAVISEIRDATARSRVETTWMPFLNVISPNSQSIKLITDFARRTGDLVVLSRPDIEILALALELENQKNGLSNIRTVPGQQLKKGKPEKSIESSSIFEVDGGLKPETGGGLRSLETPQQKPERSNEPNEDIDELSKATNSLHVSEESSLEPEHMQDGENLHAQSEGLESDDSNPEGWITPSNIQRHQGKNQNAAIPVLAAKPLDVACITSDFAMQNVLLSMNLNLLNSSLQRVRNIKTFILRCHACFEKTKDMEKQFCPRCGKPTLTRVSCSTNSKGEFKIHLKKNMQWNHRGDRYSIPKPVPGSASGKVGQGKGGGKGGWGQALILAEDQKEYLRATGENARKKKTDLMDKDYLPSILTGERGRAGVRPKVGAGRNVNSKKR
ncbi:MAG: hypothetical protein LQ343_002937 [Gyalolechia ehrenbergii]|nr:MAG: hypothetical protein LQ343_002937 [Gyalolechia ehrenbergii]